MDFMRELFGSAWAYYVGFVLVVVFIYINKKV